MNDLLEKIKRLDKKVLIGIGISVAVVSILIIALIIESGKNKTDGNKGDSLNATQYGTETENGVTEENSTENTTETLNTENATETLNTENATETEMGTEMTTTEEGQISSSTVNPNGEEILGTGNAGEPYMEILGQDYTIKTVSIGAKSSVYYDIYRVGGLYLTIKDPDAYVIYNGTTYEAKNGVVSFAVKNALASEAVRFEVGNKGTAAKSFEIKFSNLKGSYQNPEKIAALGTYNVSLSAGNEIGYYYKYTAKKTGTIYFYVSGTKPAGMSVTNNKTSANRTFEEDVQVDANGKEYIMLEVSAGDEIMILVHAQRDGKGRYPAANVTWSAVYQ